MKIPTYSLLLPIRNECDSLTRVIPEITLALQGKNYEVIAVDDASNDQSWRTLRRFSKNYPQIRIIHHATHIGKWASLRSGLAAAKGSVIITMDADLQDDPKEIPMLISKLNLGFDIVSGWRKNRQDTLYKIVISRLGNGPVSFMTQKRFYDLNSPLKVFRRSVLMTLPQEGSLLRFSLLFAYRLGYKTKEVAVVHRRRRFGTSKFGFIKYIRILYDLILIHLLFSGSGRMNNPNGLRSSQKN